MANDKLASAWWIGIRRGGPYVRGVDISLESVGPERRLEERGSSFEQQLKTAEGFRLDGMESDCSWYDDSCAWWHSDRGSGAIICVAKPDRTYTCVLPSFCIVSNSVVILEQWYGSG